jgi:hypothetical protein
MREKTRQTYLQGRTPIQALITELDKSEEWTSAVETGPDGRVKSLFFTHASQIELLSCYSDILVMDCTYKTNRYNMPLLHFLGVSPTGKYFSAAFCFLSGEEEADYSWAIEAVLCCFAEVEPEYIEPALASSSGRVL